MSDIEILFGSNAPEVTREIVNAERATIAAAKAAAQLDKAVTSEAKGLRAAAQAAREYAKELRASQNVLTGAPGRSRGNNPLSDILGNGNGAAIKTNIQRALAASNRDIRAAMEKAGEHGGGGFGSGIRRALERTLNRDGFFGAKDSSVAKLFGGGQGGAGAAATVALTAGLIALDATVKTLDFALAHHKQQLQDAAEGALSYSRAVRAATEANRAAGVSAAQAHGGSILGVVSTGGQGALDAVRAAARKAGTNENDAADAYQNLYGRFGNNSDAAIRGLEIGADVARVKGRSLGDTVATLGESELRNKVTTRDRLFSYLNHDQTTIRGSFNAAAARVAGSQDASDVVAIRGSLANADISSDNNLSAGKIGAMEVAARSGNPGAEMMQERMRAQQEELGVIRGVYERMGWLEKIYDAIRHPYDNTRAEVNRAEDRAQYESGYQPVQ